MSVSRLQTLFLFDSRRSTGLVISACILSLHNFSAEKETYDRFLALAEHEHRPISEILQDFMEDYILKHDIKKNQIQLDNYVNNSDYIPTPGYTDSWKDWQRYPKTVNDIKEADRYDQIATDLHRLWSERQNEIFMANLGKKRVIAT